MTPPVLDLVYPVQLRLDMSDIVADGKRVQISPGMAVSAEIITGDRRVIEYVLSPLLRYRHEAGRDDKLCKLQRWFTWIQMQRKVGSIWETKPSPCDINLETKSRQERSWQ